MSKHDGLRDVLRPAEVAGVVRVHVGTLRRRDQRRQTLPVHSISWRAAAVHARADVLVLLGEDDAGGEETAAVCVRVGTAKRAEAGNRCGASRKPIGGPNGPPGTREGAASWDRAGSGNGTGPAESSPVRVGVPAREAR